jgi:ribose transport system permease protein
MTLFNVGIERPESPGEMPESQLLPSRAGRLARISGVREYGTVILLLLLILIFSLTTSQFLMPRNIRSVLLLQTVTACMTLGIMFPLITGEFDLSVGYMVGFVAMIGAWLGGHGVGAPVVIVGMLGAGLIVGLVNGLLSEVLGMSSFIATLGTGIVLQGLTDGISGGSVLFKGIPQSIVHVAQGQALGLGIAVWITLGLAIVLFYLLERTPLGRSYYAVGGSERVAFLAGLRTKRLKVSAFVLTGLLVSIGAIFALGQNGSANPAFGPDLMLPAYAAVFLGVTTYRGGYYNVIGSIVGILLLAIGFNGLSLWGVPFWVQPVFNGSVLIVAVLLGRAEARRVRVGS